MNAISEMMILIIVLIISMAIGYTVGVICTDHNIQLSKKENDTVKNARFWLIKCESEPIDADECRKMACDLLRIIERRNG